MAAPEVNNELLKNYTFLPISSYGSPEIENY